MKKCAFLFLALCTLLCTACRGDDSVGTMMESFAELYPLSGQIYSTEAFVSDAGFLDPEMLCELYGEEMPRALCVSLWLGARADTVEECALFCLRDRDDAYRMTALCAERISYLSRQDPTLGGEVLRCGEYVVYFVLPDVARARRLWRRIL